jgi:hypothetical protein
MSSQPKFKICSCGKNLSLMNKHNYELHIYSCKKRKITTSNNSNITKYFAVTGPIIQTSEESKFLK